MSGDPYICPHGVMAPGFCFQCPHSARIGDVEVSMAFSTGGNVIAIGRCVHAVDLRLQRCYLCQPDASALTAGQTERLFATLDHIGRTLDRIDASLGTARKRR